MKLSAKDASAYFAKPEPGRTGLLIYGTDAMRVALKRQEVIAALIGPKGEEEMRLTRLPAADVRRDPASLTDAVKAVGFFPGPRAVLVEDANDSHTDAILPALEDWRDGEDAMTAAWMRATSPSGDASYEGQVAWSGELGYGVREPERGQTGSADRPARES